MAYYFAVVPYGQEELYHFGIKGMKWGVRRYRNKDGSYTAAGKRRYKIFRKKQTVNPTYEHLMGLTDPDEIYRYRHLYSDRDLQGRLNRLNTEENIYRKTRAAKRRQFAATAGKWAWKTAAVVGPSVFAARQIYKKSNLKDPNWNKVKYDGKSYNDYMWEIFQKTAPGKKKH